jgi:hypothetical protein
VAVDAAPVGDAQNELGVVKAVGVTDVAPHAGTGVLALLALGGGGLASSSHPQARAAGWAKLSSESGTVRI